MEILKSNLHLVYIAAGASIFLFICWIVYLQISLSRLKKKSRDLFAGGKVKNLEDILLQQAKNIRALDKDIQELYNISNQINGLAFRSLHRVGMIRFNPFKEVGGDQSFAIALLNGKNNGLSISSLYTREGTRVYAKAIVGGKSEKHPLTEEEEQAIRLAQASEPKKFS